MTPNDAQLKEYELLRQELLQLDRAVLQAIGLIIGFIGVITAQGLTSGNPFVYLITLPLVFGFSFYIFDKRWGIFLIASYLKNYIENPESGPRWETQLYYFRNVCKKQNFIQVHNIIKIECGFIVLLSIIEYGLFVYFGYIQNLPFWQLIIPIPFILVLIWHTTSEYNVLMHEGKDGGRLDRLWEEAENLRLEINNK